MKSARFFRWLVFLYPAAIALLGFFSWWNNPTPRDITTWSGVVGCALYTLLLYLTRRWWLPRLAQNPLRSAFVLGSVNAMMAETIFWAFERFYGASGVAAHPNLLLDLILTMPWYIGMVYLFVRVQQRQRFGTAVLFLLAGLYEMGADGIVGGVIVPTIIGDTPMIFTDFFGWLFFMFLAFGYFMWVYSPMILPAAWVINDVPRSEVAVPLPAPLLDALRPLWWLLPYTAYLIAALFFLFMAGLTA